MRTPSFGHPMASRIARGKRRERGCGCHMDEMKAPTGAAGRCRPAPECRDADVPSVCPPALTSRKEVSVQTELDRHPHDRLDALAMDARRKKAPAPQRGRGGLDEEPRSVRGGPRLDR